MIYEQAELKERQIARLTQKRDALRDGLFSAEDWKRQIEQIDLYTQGIKRLRRELKTAYAEMEA